MSYQYPPPPGLRSDFESPQMAGSFQLPSVICRDRDPLQAPDDRLPQDLNSNPQSSSKVGEIVRSTSTPNVRGQAAADAALAASAEKRRNKLGYHRTSVACGWCPDSLFHVLTAALLFKFIHMLTYFRTLPAEEDSVYSRSGRPAKSMCELH